ncbi:putative integral membrane protein (TIGR02206 family) [Paenibacillus sp. JGP012]|uniref:YwaF family protein n=1 Tax=Paenibacillus sp. JGP012 TaxID=2735914 RepID=UPI00161C584E|nr:TIGR02206 family membrane protein [Paenibacillus sp. JGP012]MBB6023170.1 putative integral membrane protein (TIGR02206 family) [Paenibacillus sp. JGP012]
MAYAPWLDPYDAAPFMAFSTSHIISMIIIALLVLLLFLFRHSLRKLSERSSRLLRVGLASMMIGSEIVLQLWYVYGGVWSLQTSLPLELCSLTLLLSALLLLTRTRWLYSALLFAGIAGALMAIVTPNLGYAYAHFRFIQFFTAHAMIILALLYMTWVEQFRPGWRSVAGSMIFVNIAALVVYAADVLLGANYMFLRHKPNTPSVIDMLGPYPVYILGEEILALVLFTMLYLVLFVIPDCLKRYNNRRKTKAHQVQSKL